MSQKHSCLNCATVFEGKYCPNCGQSASTHRIDWHVILHDLQHFFHLENALFYTARELLLRPGVTIRNYTLGKHKRYFGPLSTLLTVAGMYILLYQLSQIDPLNIMAQMIYALDEVFYNGQLFVPDWIADNYAFVELFLFLPMFSVASYLSFYRAKYNFLEHFAINAYLSAQRMLIGVLTFPILYLFKGDSLSGIVEIVISFLELAFTVWAYLSFFTQFKILPRLGLIALTFLIVFVELSLFMLVSDYLL
ncbi:MAG: DUF3667 domain-containing protein [Leptolyngbya sp. SIO3F4]|nr:DUF3667 domain-containing protein [Leptolyngbya sp. SIO3F4]